MSSRNATRQDFEHVVASIKEGRSKARYLYNTSDDVKKKFESWLNPASSVIKAMVE